MIFLGAVTFRSQRKQVTTCLVQQRALSGAEAVSALRPFYFAVHPDFFGQYPYEREVNENSLKRLNGYLENLQKPGSNLARSTELTFFVRDTKENSEKKAGILHSGFRSVTFILHTNNVLSTVMNVLTSCSLPVEHIKELKERFGTFKSVPDTGVPFYRPIKWDKSFYTFTGFRDPEQELQQARTVEPTLQLVTLIPTSTLCHWLRNNEPVATKKYNASLPQREELSRLKKELCLKFRLADIRWQRSWGVAHKYCQLQSLSRLSHQSPEALINLQGHTVVFADQSGMNASGEVLLGTMDVHHRWNKLFQQLPSYQSLQQQTDWLKERISDLLGGSQVINLERLGPIQPISEHYMTLSTFHQTLMSRCLRLHPRSLHGLTLVLERLQVEEEAVVKLCLQGLSLRNISKEPSVSSRQMILCCKRLMEQHSPLMQGLNVCVSHFYSVMQDGDLCVPWDWKS
ncbi:T-cell activation inhibitor, mitochondrial isoform X3 [Girardinichthys multiradiatus]|uniref:T-cell activation inhibitor, mitochondrial isoform X3 n=1 Tax=Girardinichthys multiradiatus TaxID=208333 RepID=UPI001FAD509A|nr:T-cell activation inhibitor, mitochondrial isoform X3 [Girardinichthys multiradiatus]